MNSATLVKRESARLSWRYHTALREHLKRRRSTGLPAAEGLGRRAVTMGLGTLDVARIHEQALITLVLPGDSPVTRAVTVRRAGVFFARALTPIEQTHRTAYETSARLAQLNQMLRQRIADLAASKRQLTEQIDLRRLAEDSLRKSEEHYGQMLKQSRQMQEDLRHLSRQLLLAQEEERKKISRELHDVIAQTLTTINVRLATLKKEAALSTKGLDRNIARTQELVAHSVDIVHRFARELRPAVLDDLGLIPALHTFLKHFRAETRIQVRLAAFPAVEQVNGDKRTVLYRVAQESLTNVARHAQASRVEVTIRKLAAAVCMTIKDDGKGFQTQRVSHTKKAKRLGLLGMRERLEMVGGNFNITSVPGKGTTVIARVPLMNRPPGGCSSDSNPVR